MGSIVAVGILLCTLRLCLYVRVPLHEGKENARYKIDFFIVLQHKLYTKIIHTRWGDKSRHRNKTILHGGVHTHFTFLPGVSCRHLKSLSITI